MINEPIEDEQDKDLDHLRRAGAQLSEHFDTVQIFCTRHDSQKKLTITCHHGSGNWYARYGHVKMWTAAEENESEFNKSKEEF